MKTGVCSNTVWMFYESYDGETPIDTNGMQGFYNYGMSWNKAEMGKPFGFSNAHQYATITVS